MPNTCFMQSGLSSRALRHHRIPMFHHRDPGRLSPDHVQPDHQVNGFHDLPCGSRAVRPAVADRKTTDRIGMVERTPDRSGLVEVYLDMESVPSLPGHHKDHL